MTNTSAEITHSRPVPPEWTNLVSLAQSQLDTAGEGGANPQVVDTLLDAVSQIDNESLEAARYYGIGLVMCGFAQTLRKPEVRQGAIDHAVGNIVSRWKDEGLYAGKELRINDISSYAASFAFTRIAQAASNALPPAEHLVADVLEQAAFRRRQDITQDTALALRPAEERSYAIEAVLKGDGTARKVGQNAVSAAMGVLRVTLRKKHAKNNPPNQAHTTQPATEFQEAPSPTVAEATGEEGVEGLGWDAIAQRCAVLRQDEFQRDIDRYIDISTDGKAKFRRDQMVSSKQLLPPEILEFKSSFGTDKVAVLHSNRLKCPAVFVEIHQTPHDPETAEEPKTSKASKSLVSLTVEIVNEIVIAAQARAKEELARKARHDSFWY